MSWFSTQDLWKSKVVDLEYEVKILKIEIYKLKNRLSELEPEPKQWEAGDRVKGSPECGFHRSMRGTIRYVEPNGKCWVRRDGASSDCFFMPHELEAE